MKFTTTQISVATAALAGSRRTGASAPGSFKLDGQTLRAIAPTGLDRYRDAMTPLLESKLAELLAQRPAALGLSAYESFVAWTAWVTAIATANHWLAERAVEVEQQVRWALAAEATLPAQPATATRAGGAGPAPVRTAAAACGSADPLVGRLSEPGDASDLQAPSPMRAWLERWRATAAVAAASRATKASSERLAPRGSRLHPPDSALRHHSPAPERSRSVALAIEHHGADG
jgi:hypothetical protein